MKAPTKNNPRWDGDSGQALLEWILMSIALISLWSGMVTLAAQLLKRSSVEAMSWMAARRTLSKQVGFSQKPAFFGLNVRGNRSRGFAQAQWEGVTSAALITVPQNKLDLLSCISAYFGFPCSQSSE